MKIPLKKDNWIIRWFSFVLFRLSCCWLYLLFCRHSLPNCTYNRQSILSPCRLHLWQLATCLILVRVPFIFWRSTLDPAAPLLGDRMPSLNLRRKQLLKLVFYFYFICAHLLALIGWLINNVNMLLTDTCSYILLIHTWRFFLIVVEEFRSQLALIKEEYGHEELHKKFMAIAEEESDCGSAKNGGDLGIFEKGNWIKRMLIFYAEWEWVLYYV